MSDELASFRPGADHAWSVRTASHLLRRAGFAPSRVERDRALSDGPRATVDRLIDGADEETQRHDELDAVGERLARANDIGALRGWWLLRMRHTARPLHARMALFWHGFFATSNEKVGNAALMLRQLRLFERNALGRFDAMLAGVLRDPAMMVWLDSERNVKGRPNENFARELFELFSLGVGNYTEADVAEAARALTGWRQRNGRVEFVRRNHDTGVKTVLGVTGPLDGDDVLRLALGRPACSRFLARKLLVEFLAPAPPAALVEAVAARLRATSLHVGETLRTLLASRAMFETRWYRARIKSPVEYVMSIARPLELSTPAPVLARATEQMGQRLFEPPTVNGWEGGRSWLDSTTMLVRLNAVTAAIASERFDPARLAANAGTPTTERERGGLVRELGELVLDGDVPDVLRPRLDGLSGPTPEVVRETLRLLMSSPEFQFA